MPRLKNSWVCDCEKGWLPGQTHEWPCGPRAAGPGRGGAGAAGPFPLLQSGRVKSVGVSNHNPAQIKEADEILKAAAYPEAPLILWQRG